MNIATLLDWTLSIDVDGLSIVLCLIVTVALLPVIYRIYFKFIYSPAHTSDPDTLSYQTLHRTDLSLVGMTIIRFQKSRKSRWQQTFASKIINVLDEVNGRGILPPDFTESDLLLYNSLFRCRRKDVLDAAIAVAAILGDECTIEELDWLEVEPGAYPNSQYWNDAHKQIRAAKSNLQKRLMAEQNRLTLVRPADAPSEKDLLRPAGSGRTLDNSSLARPAEPPPH